jgi:maltooligosyltrehalose trehalohydrolase
MAHLFRVWAPEKERVLLHLLNPVDELLEMRREEGEGGWFSLDVPAAEAGSRYRYLLDDGREYPDPASHYQPEGVHGPSEVVSHAGYPWRVDAWPHRPFAEWVLYEMHVGAFTPEGTFDAVIPRLDDLKALGVTALELMPVAQFPGERNWGYDGTYPYAVQNSYGGPEGLKRLVDACHERGLAVVLDVVYNHLGPEGNYAAPFGPYFTQEYRTPWGGAVNLDGRGSDGVRAFILGNMRHWFEHYRIDGLRLDAIHAMFDKSATHLWEEAHRQVKTWSRNLGRPFLLIAESDLNNPRVVSSPEVGGYGFDAQWLDDFHHALYVLVDPRGKRHYEDFGTLQQLAKAYTDGFVHSGEYVRFRQRHYGASSAHVPRDRFVVFNQNHDQVGNRVLGERLCHLVDADRLKVAAAAMLLSPYIPLLFMGEEYGEDAPFQFFADYGDEEVRDGMREGRKREFASFQWGEADPPDPVDPETFLRSKLRWESRNEGTHAELLQWHRDLIALRAAAPFRNHERESVSAEVVGERGLMLRRWAEEENEENGVEEAVCLFNFSDAPLAFALPAGIPWRVALDARGDASTEAPGESVTLPGWTARVLTGRIRRPLP